MKRFIKVTFIVMVIFFSIIFLYINANMPGKVDFITMETEKLLVYHHKDGLFKKNCYVLHLDEEQQNDDIKNVSKVALDFHNLVKDDDYVDFKGMPTLILKLDDYSHFSFRNDTLLFYVFENTQIEYLNKIDDIELVIKRLPYSN